MACTILRQEDGVLGGFVGVGDDNPLFGFEIDTVPSALGISPDGSPDYAARCEHWPTEITICHPKIANRKRPGPSKNGDDNHGSHEPLWWLGFHCDRNHDLVPGCQVDANDLGAESGQVYRDVAYVCSQTCKLARQLRAAVDGYPPLTDHTDQTWRSVREYFWTVGLGMVAIPRTDTRNQELKFMRATLVSLDRRVI